MIHRKISHHFLPHYFVEPGVVERDGGLTSHDQIHHRAHGVSLGALFVYLQILLFFTVGLFIVQIKAPQILGTANFSADEIIALTNLRRQENGVGALTYNPLLASAAAQKAVDMHANDYWAHNSPTGVTPWFFISGAGYKYVFAGENLARDFSSASSTVEAWMNSPSHRNNILDRNFKEIGVAVTNGKLGDKEGSLVVQMFGASVSQVAPTAPVAQERATPVPAASKTLPSVSPSPLPSPVAVANVRDSALAVGNSQATVLASRQFSIAKGVSLGLVGFIFALLVLEVVVTLQRAHVSLRSGILAHLMLLGFVLIVVWYAVGGAIL
ncbi:MAG: CAP domain-containing protein [Candidatus Curtissbacteria bacterium]|nr:CAP domain-containing protein [Candidatus Curtissbacteria bacterium]